MLNAQEGQTYICTKSDKPWWTRGKEYKVASTKHGLPCLVDDDGDSWELDSLEYDTCQFKLKETSSFKNYGKLRFSMDELPDEKEMTKMNELITLTRIDETTVYVNINHIAAFYHNKAWEYTIVILSDGTQLDIKDSVESIAKYF